MPRTPCVLWMIISPTPVQRSRPACSLGRTHQMIPAKFVHVFQPEIVARSGRPTRDSRGGCCGRGGRCGCCPGPVSELPKLSKPNGLALGPPSPLLYVPSTISMAWLLRPTPAAEVSPTGLEAERDRFKVGTYSACRWHRQASDREDGVSVVWKAHAWIRETSEADSGLLRQCWYTVARFQEVL